MNRRKFLKNGSLAAISLTTLTIVSCNTSQNSKNEKDNPQNSLDIKEKWELEMYTPDYYWKGYGLVGDHTHILGLPKDIRILAKCIKRNKKLSIID